MYHGDIARTKYKINNLFFKLLTIYVISHIHINNYQCNLSHSELNAVVT